MKAISLHQPFATMIRDGVKTIETRRWPTSHRGPLVICSTRKPTVAGHLSGYALAIVDVVGCRPMTKTDEPAACYVCYRGAWAWELANVRPFIVPFPVRGYQRIFNLDLELPAEIDCAETTNPNPQESETMTDKPTEPTSDDGLKEILPTPDEKLKYILAADQGVRAAETRLANAKTETKEARDQLKTAAACLRDLIGEARDGLPLFDEAEKPTESTDSTDSTDEGEPDAKDAPANDEHWRRFFLGALDGPTIPHRTIKALAENDPPILTLGDLSDWQEKKGDFWAKDIKGVGTAAAGKIADATDAFWARMDLNTRSSPPDDEKSTDSTDSTDSREDAA